jgi:carbohydrate kinase (thermoresistant glucokinase family)
MVARSVVVMGVSGSGKSTIGQLLAKRTDGFFRDGDRLHPDANVRKMAAGIPLDDADRLPWLRTIGEHLQKGLVRGTDEIVACSALKRSYRDLIREYVPDLFVVFLDGPPEVIRARLLARSHEYMPSSLLDSQLADLEPLEADERGCRVSILDAPDTIIAQAVAAMAVPAGGP